MPDALPEAQPTASNHLHHNTTCILARVIRTLSLRLAKMVKSDDTILQILRYLHFNDRFSGEPALASLEFSTPTLG